MEDSFNMYCESKSYILLLTTYSSAASMYNPSTPTPRRSVPNQLSLDFEGKFGHCTMNGELTSHFSPLSEYLFGGQVAAEILLSNKAFSTTPMKRLDDMATPYYDHMFKTTVVSRQSSDPIIPAQFVSPYAISPTADDPELFVATSTHHQSAPEAAGSTSLGAYSNDSVISLFPIEGLESLKTELVGIL